MMCSLIGGSDHFYGRSHLQETRHTTELWGQSGCFGAGAEGLTELPSSLRC